MALIPSRPPGSVVTPDPPGRLISGAIINVSSPAWRRRLQLASFKGMPFYVDQQGRSSGRRIVAFEYPMRDVPYAEDMGRAVIRYQMTGYLIQAPGAGPNQSATLYNGMPRDYDVARDALESALLSPGPGVLIDPFNPRLFVTLPGYSGVPVLFACEHYSLVESRERGGYCQFEMTFVEAGQPANFTATALSSVTAIVNNMAAAATAAQADNTDAAQAEANSQTSTSTDNPATAPVQVPETPVPPGDNPLPPDIAIPF